MTEAISDTGPILHLHEIERLPALSSFSLLRIPELVAEELSRFDLSLELASSRGSVEIRLDKVPAAKWRKLLAEPREHRIHPADAQVAILAIEDELRRPILTDDLALRHLLEARGGTVTGTVGILVRAFHTGLLDKAQLESSIESLFSASTLHLGKAFRRYVLSLIAEL